MYTFLLFLLFLFWLYIDIKDYHINRNRYNVLPVGKLTLIKTNEYRDENGIRWLKRGFLHSLLHNPFKYYVFETYDSKIESSSEFIVLHLRTIKLPSSSTYHALEKCEGVKC